MKYVKREMWRGDSMSFDVTVTNPETCGPLDLTGAKLWFTAKNNYIDPDERAVIRLDSALLGGITITDAERGLARVTIEPIKTRGSADGIVRLVYDCQVKDAGGFIATIESGTLFIYPDVTRAIS